MITLHSGAYYTNKTFAAQLPDATPQAGREKTMAYRILRAHNQNQQAGRLSIRFDALASHDITYVGIVQTARASGLEKFPMPYVLTNCHNSLCAVGGTLNEDDHRFGLSAAKKYGGIFVPAHMAVIHQYMREMHAGCGRMILGSDSHTRYGAIGTMAVGEGGPEIVKQLLSRTWDIADPEVVCVHLTGKPQPGVGPQDVALAIIRQVFDNGFVKNKVMEFVGPGIASLSMDYRNGIDVMTTETACLTSIWETDEVTRNFLALHGRAGDYAPLHPQEGAYYDGIIEVDLSTVQPMIALPFHPSNAYTIAELKANLTDILRDTQKKCAQQSGQACNLLGKVYKDELYVDQGVIAGCSGGLYENIFRAAEILDGTMLGAEEFALSVYAASQPMGLYMANAGITGKLMQAGAVLRSAFCGPCFGAGDTPSNGSLSIRHTTRNFPSREGSKPGEGQMAYVALMDARSIAATAKNGGRLTAATELDLNEQPYTYGFDPKPYQARVYQGFEQPQPQQDLVFGPNIADWPHIQPLPENLLLQVSAAIYDPVTTTDELIPSGDTSTYRSNPIKLASFALSRKDPGYVARAQGIHELEKSRLQGELSAQAQTLLALTGRDVVEAAKDTGIGSLVFAVRPGDGSAREQAASVQKVLGGWANLCEAYATKRYRSNVVNWGMLPFQAEGASKLNLAVGDVLYVPGLKTALEGDAQQVEAVLYQNGQQKSVMLGLPGLTRDERDVILAGCLMNYYAAQNAAKE